MNESKKYNIKWKEGQKTKPSFFTRPKTWLFAFCVFSHHKTRVFASQNNNNIMSVVQCSIMFNVNHLFRPEHTFLTKLYYCHLFLKWPAELLSYLPWQVHRFLLQLPNVLHYQVHNCNANIYNIVERSLLVNIILDVGPSGFLGSQVLDSILDIFLYRYEAIQIV